MDLESSSSTPPASADLTSSDLEHQRDYFYAGKTLSWESRKAALKALKAAVQAHEDQVLKALAADLGKPAFEAFSTEIGMFYQEVNTLLKSLKDFNTSFD